MSAVDTAPARPVARGGWPLERVLFAMAGTVTLVSVVLARLVNPRFLLLTVFAGANQLLFTAVGACPVSWVLVKVFHLRSTSGASRLGVE